MWTLLIQQYFGTSKVICFVKANNKTISTFHFENNKIYSIRKKTNCELTVIRKQRYWMADPFCIYSRWTTSHLITVLICYWKLVGKKKIKLSCCGFGCVIVRVPCISLSCNHVYNLIWKKIKVNLFLHPKL